MKAFFDSRMLQNVAKLWMIWISESRRKWDNKSSYVLRTRKNSENKHGRCKQIIAKLRPREGASYRIFIIGNNEWNLFYTDNNERQLRTVAVRRTIRLLCLTK